VQRLSLSEEDDDLRKGRSTIHSVFII